MYIFSSPPPDQGPQNPTRSGTHLMGNCRKVLLPVNVEGKMAFPTMFRCVSTPSCASPFLAAQYPACFQTCCVFSTSCSSRAAVTFQTAVASYFRPLRGDVYAARFQGVGGMWPSFLSSFLAGLATPICSGEAKATRRRAQIWSGVRENTRGSAYVLCLLFFFIPSVSPPVKGGSSSPRLCLGPFRCPCWASPASPESVSIATCTKQLKG